MTGEFIRKGQRETADTQEKAMERQAEIGVMQPQTKKHLGPPEAGRDKGAKDSPLEPENPWPYQRLGFGLLASRTVRQKNLLFKTPSLGQFATVVLGN